MKLVKMGESIRTVAYKIDYFLLKYFGERLIKSKGIRKIHFSIDDVFDVVVDEHSFVVDDLRKLNIEYGLASHLFLFYKYSGRVLNQIPMLLKNLNFLYYGAYQAEYIEEIYDKIGTARSSKYVRLHEFKVTPEQLKKPKTDTLVVFAHESKYKLISERWNLLCELLFKAGIEFV